MLWGLCALLVALLAVRCQMRTGQALRRTHQRESDSDSLRDESRVSQSQRGTTRVGGYSGAIGNGARITRNKRYRLTQRGRVEESSSALYIILDSTMGRMGFTHNDNPHHTIDIAHT